MDATNTLVAIALVILLAVTSLRNGGERREAVAPQDRPLAP